MVFKGAVVHGEESLLEQYMQDGQKASSVPDAVGHQDGRVLGGGQREACGWVGLPDHPLVMGILNVTPDSFSDGGRHVVLAAALAAGQAMVAAGVDILDIGGETTRPGARPVPPEEEQVRVLPVIRALRDLGVPISVDTRNASTMRAAVEAGARIINDVSALAHDPHSAAVVAELGCPVVLMHMRGTPQTMDGLAVYGDVARDVTAELAERIRHAEAAGIAREQIIVDPGLGFAKNDAQNVMLLKHLDVLQSLGCRILVGASRKRFIGTLVNESDPRRRDAGSMAAHLFALDRGASILRVHDVAPTVQAVKVWRALAGAG